MSSPKSLEFEARYPSELPWNRTLRGIKERCNNESSPSYSRYGARGIKCLISSEELKKLWYRDKANLLKEPSINRKDSKGNYIFKNCEYIEKRLNSRLGNLRGTHCIHGHPYTPENTKVNKKTGHAHCHTCQLATSTRWYRRRQKRRSLKGKEDEKV